ncbi:MAG: C25 family cysteine peptidase [Bacteroidales bacterium]|nr:C25 family cysteine peptidase [Bacteroidales bacterium]
MKKLQLLLVAVFISSGLFASDWIKINSDQPKPADITLISSNIKTSTLHFSMEGFWQNAVQTPQGEAWVISLEEGGRNLLKGAPDLPVFASSIIIPGQAKMQMEIVSARYKDFENVLIAPSKGNLPRTIDPATVPYEFGLQYNRDDFYPGKLSQLRDPYVVRDYRGQTVLFHPFQYNPVTKTLRVYFDITVKVIESGVSRVNALDKNYRNVKVNKQYKAIYQHHFLNYNATGSRYTPVEEQGNMLIISYGDFMDQMQPLIDWRIQAGTPVEMVNVESIGGSSDIKQYVADYYNDNGLTFLLLVGDAAQVPSSVIAGNDSDNDYAYVAGNDHYPDLFVGRFSAEDTNHVNTMVRRTLDYEKNPIADTAWYSKAIGIGSDQGPGDDDELDYEHIRNIADSNLLPFTYMHTYELFDGSQGGEDADENPTPAMVTTNIESGATIINYVGHGSDYSWGTSGFSINHVNNLTNTGKLPFIFSVACVNGNFVNQTCFAEAWLRAEYDDEPTGAIAAFMSTINQSWNPPMRGQDEMNDILTETYEDNIKRTFGGIAMNGCMNMNDVYGSDGDVMTDTWTIFGDPSLAIRTAVPDDMTVTHPVALQLGDTSMTISCDAEGALAALTMEGEILGTATVEGGSATITFDPLDGLGFADFVVTAFNYRPYITSIEIIPPDGPYVVYAAHEINDAAGNNNGQLDYNESILLTVGLVNVGNEDAMNVDATLFVESEYVQFNDTTEFYGTIVSKDTVSVTDAFAFDVAGSVPDGQEIKFNVSAQDGEGRSIWESSFYLTAHAPKLNFLSFSIDDSEGNGNGKMDPGETVNLLVDIVNNGSSAAFNVMGNLLAESDYVTVNSSAQNYGNLDAADTAQAVYSVSCEADTPDGHLAPFSLNLLADFNITGEGSFQTTVGQKPVLLLKLAESSPSANEMQLCLATLQVGCDEVSAIPEDLNTYRSVFVLLGVYPDNRQLSDVDGELLKAFLQNGGRVYMEGGDTWAYDAQTAVHPLFFIEGVSDGNDDLSVIEGQAGTLAEAFSFPYDGNNNYIDQIAAQAGADLIFMNDAPAYGVGVSYENQTYKTIGTSFEFGGLTDQQGGTKDELMAAYLRFFGITYDWVGINKNSKISVQTNVFPNPFSDEVSISIKLEKTTRVEIEVYDLGGKKVKTLVCKKLDSGNHRFIWEANGIQPGIYFSKLTIGDIIVTKKLLLMK